MEGRTRQTLCYKPFQSKTKYASYSNSTLNALQTNLSDNKIITILQTNWKGCQTWTPGNFKHRFDVLNVLGRNENIIISVGCTFHKGFSCFCDIGTFLVPDYLKKNNLGQFFRNQWKIFVKSILRHILFLFLQQKIREIQTNLLAKKIVRVFSRKLGKLLRHFFWQKFRGNSNWSKKWLNNCFDDFDKINFATLYLQHQIKINCHHHEILFFFRQINLW